MLIWDLDVPNIESGDILAVASTGAYGYSMANHYNRFAKPAVVLLKMVKIDLLLNVKPIKMLLPMIYHMNEINLKEKKRYETCND